MRALMQLREGTGKEVFFLYRRNHLTSREILSLTSNEGSSRLDLCRELVVIRWVATSLAPAVI